MLRHPLIRWIAAGLVAITTAVVVATDLAELHRRARTLGPERSVVIATRDLALGTTLEPDDLTTRKVHESQLPDHVATDVDALTGSVVVVPILEGGFLSDRQLAPGDRSGVTAVVPVGSRAIRVVPVSSPEVAPGDIVDVLATFDGAVPADVVARLALVVRVDEDSDGEFGARPGVTLLVESHEASPVADAVALGALTLALAAPEEATAMG